VLAAAPTSAQHVLTAQALKILHRRVGRPVLEHELADELDVLVTGDMLPPPVDLVLLDLHRAGMSVQVGNGWLPADEAGGATVSGPG
jgi:hypothetical protein